MYSTSSRLLVLAGTVNMAAVPVACSAQVCGPRSTLVMVAVQYSGTVSISIGASTGSITVTIAGSGHRGSAGLWSSDHGASCAVQEWS